MKKKKNKIEQNQTKAEAIDQSKRWDGHGWIQRVGWWAHDKVDQTEDDRSSRDKSINNQAQPRGDTVEAGGGGNRWHNGMVEKCHSGTKKERGGK
jgi:hypothetical protein